MEQRSSERKAVALHAVIGCPRFGLIRGTIVDMGTGGLYVRAETSIVPLGADVTVTFQPDEVACTRCLSVKGRVSHQSLHGFGIEFTDIDAYCLGILKQFLPQMPPAPGRARPVLRAI